ncbi:MAG: 3-deoxy-D-manno-octulosonic acid kinase [Chromatiales bacterium]|jgi:3-deoxy-D-manno-octulosonic acid kinase|nr:3-deoxy-D-manno-octulosonic acid kinase [Chromatiales bacterium]
MKYSLPVDIFYLPKMPPPEQRVERDMYVLFDADLIAAPDAAFFDQEHWRHSGAMLAEASGRGAACIFKHAGKVFVLRHYRRGGLIARISADRYLWTGLERTRAWREWKLLALMQAAGLPVPHPIAARVQRHGVFYSADLITRYIDGATPLADMIAARALSLAEWGRIGMTIARFHADHIFHADLNARNILLTDADAVYLIDFDKAKRCDPGSWQQGNLARLRRSLDKFKAANAGLHFDDAAWNALTAAYGAALSQGSSASR